MGLVRIVHNTPRHDRGNCHLTTQPISDGWITQCGRQFRNYEARKAAPGEVTRNCGNCIKIARSRGYDVGEE